MGTPIDIHHSESTLSALARSGSGPDAHVLACPRCRNVYEFYRSYFALESTEFSRPVTDEDEKRARDILSPGVYRLEPFRVHLSVRSDSREEKPVLLAALDGSAQGNRFVTVAAFASQTINTVVRVLHDVRTGEDSLHVLSPDRSLRSRVEIGISDGRGTLLRVSTDEEGICKLDPDTRIDWAAAQLILSAPASAHP